MNDVNAHTEGFSDGVNGRCTASGCVGPQRSPTLHIYDPPWDALGYNASVARAVAASTVLMVAVDTRSVVGRRPPSPSPSARALRDLAAPRIRGRCPPTVVVLAKMSDERIRRSRAAAPLPVGHGVPAAGRALRRALDRAGAAGARQPNPVRQANRSIFTCFMLRLHAARAPIPGHPHRRGRSPTTPSRRRRAPTCQSTRTPG